MKKFDFSILRKVDVLNFDKTLVVKHKEKIIKNFESKINIFCLLKSTFKCLYKLKIKNFITNLKKEYFYNYCKKLNPKIVIGNEIDLQIFKFKKLFPEKISIVFQLSLYKTEYKFLTKQRLDTFKTDYFLVYDQWHKKYFDFFNTKFLTVGSVKANYNIKQNLKKKYDILFISSYRPNSHIDPINYYYYSSKVCMVDTYLSYKKVADYCDLKSKKLAVALSSNRKEKIHKINKEDEVKFFDGINKNYYTEDANCFNLANQSNLIIVTHSTLGVELLNMGHKVLFLNNFSNLGSLHLFEEKPSTGKFWINNDQLNGLNEKITDLIEISNEEYESLVKDENIIKYYDKNNSQLINLINKHA